MSDFAGNEPLTFSFFAADQLASAFRSAATAVEGHSTTRTSLVSTAQEEFRGRFSELFATNATTAQAGAEGLIEAFREVARLADALQEAAKAENARRRAAKEWQKRQDERNLLEHIGDAFTGGEEPPRMTADEPPKAKTLSVDTGVRETPTPGGTGGTGGGTSSAKPEDLRSFATGSRGLDGELADRPGTLRGKLSDFAAQCDFGSIDADGVVSAFEAWLSANDRDAAWATTIADAFAAANGENAVSTLSDAGLLAALQAAGVSASREGLVIDPPRTYGVVPTTGFTMDPINTSTGNFLEVEVDLSFSGTSSALRVTRTYNSLDSRVGVFGLGWGSSLDARLVVDDEGATARLGDGRHQFFARRGDGWDRAEGENVWLSRLDDAARRVPGMPARTHYVVRDNAGAWRAYGPSGLWLGSGSGPGTSIRVERDADALITRLIHARGRWVDVEYVDGRVVVLAGSDGRRVKYTYDDQGHLSAATTAVGTRHYRWNDRGLVEAVVSEAGVVEAENVYDTQRRVVRQRTPHGRTARFAYLHGRVTVVSDDDGKRSNTYVADSKGRLVGVTDADDHRQSMSYDQHGNLVSVTARDGSITVHGYDGRGRRIRTVTPSGADITWGWDEHDRITTLVSESGAVVSYEYADDLGRDPSVVVDPEGGRTALTWREGLLVRLVDPTGVVLTCRHDAYGELVETENALGDVIRIERDRVGHPVAVTTPSGARTTFRFDDSGLLTSRRDADGAIWRFDYAAGGRIAAIVDPLGARTEFVWGDHGELETTIDPLGRRVTRTFDDQGDLSGLVLPDGGSWSFVHDAISRLVAVTDPAGGTWTREHDVSGDLSAVIDPTGVRVEAERNKHLDTETLRDAFDAVTIRLDEFGRPVRTESSDGSAKLTTYDRCGRPVELVDGEGGLTRLERDGAGRVVALVAPSGTTTRWEYDSCGRPVAEIDPLGARISLTYDADSRVMARTLATGEVERVTYDAVGRVTSRAIPGGGTARYRYDLAGRLVAAQDSRSGRRRFRHDAAGQLVEAQNGLGGITSYDYDRRGRLVSVTDPAGGVTRRTWDDADRLTSVTDPLGRTTCATWDAAGRRLSRTDADGTTTEWSYDAAGRGAGVRVDGRIVSSVTRDAFSRSVVVMDHTLGEGREVEHELARDRRGLLVRRGRGAEAIEWEYDADGRLAARTDPNGARTVWQRDAVGRMVRVERDGVTVGTFTYDAAGRIVGSATGDRLQTWSYERGALVEHTTTTSEGVVRTRVECDDDARITAVDNGGSRVCYQHDDAAQLIRAVDLVGRERTWDWDAAGRLVRETIDGLHIEHEHDVAGQLVATTAGHVRTEYVHDGLGRRIRRVASDGATTEYAWSDLGYLSAVTEKDSSNAETGRVEIWVDALGELATAAGTAVWWDTAAAVPSVVSIDGASVVDLPGGTLVVGDESSEPRWREARPTALDDPWAMATVGAGSLSLPRGIGLTPGGSVTVGGLEWLGARVYDPAERGFLSTDPLAPVVGAAWASNPWSYAGNDPLHALDPLGLRPATDSDLDAYAKANQGAFANLEDWANEHADDISSIAIGIGVGLTVLAMFTPLGPIAAVAVMVGAGAALSGGLSIQKNKGPDGKVAWGQVGLDTLVGGASGAAGGGAAVGLSKLAPAVSTAGASAVRSAASQVLGSTGRSAIASGVSGAVSNTGTYAFDPRIEDKNAAGYVGSAATGFGFGAAFSVGAGKAGEGVVDLLNVPSTNLAGTATTTAVVDHLMGGLGGAVNEWFRPGSARDAGDVRDATITGLLSGANGPTVGLHRAPTTIRRSELD